MSLDLNKDILEAARKKVKTIYVEVAYGKWLPVFYNGKLTGGKCSVCGKYKKAYNMTNLRKNYKFCHGCGTKMKNT